MYCLGVGESPCPSHPSIRGRASMETSRIYTPGRAFQSVAYTRSEGENSSSYTSDAGIQS